MNLNESQIQAISHKDGPMLVLAGPGSGKTSTITHRIHYLIEKHHILPQNILVITFTRAAAEEMQLRFQSLCAGRRLPVAFGTFHSFFFRILKFAYHYRPDNILSEEMKIQMLKEIIEKFSLEIEDEAEFLSGISSEISIVKGEMISLQNYYSKNCPEDIFREIYRRYEKGLRNRNKIDFDDMLSLCYELLSKRNDILKLWQEQYPYILIDEFQDINKIQYEIIKLLAQPRKNLFIVGDDDQSIYRFRGAKPEIMLNFEKDFPETQKILLNMNYRSGKEIVKAAENLISHNHLRFDKQIIADKLEENPIDIQEFATIKEETMQVANRITEGYKQGLDYREFAVLFRTNMGAKAIVERLMEYNIPFHMRDKLPNLYEHWIAQNLFSYIRIALGEESRAKYLQIINRPNRYISREAFRFCDGNLEQLIEYYQEDGKEWMAERIEQLQYDLRMLGKMSPYAAISYIRKGIGYEEYLLEYADYRRMKAEELLSILDEIAENAKEYRTYQEWFLHIRTYSEELEKQKENKEREKRGVELATMHSAKGMEYSEVFVIDCNEGVVPYVKAVLEEEIEEERRLFYVAITRAKDKLHLYSVKERYNKEQVLSRFLDELKEAKSKKTY